MIAYVVLTGKTFYGLFLQQMILILSDTDKRSLPGKSIAVDPILFVWVFVGFRILAIA